MGNWRVVSTPTINGKVIYFPFPRGQTIETYQVEDNGKLETLWTYSGHVPDVCCPTFYDGKLYLVHEGTQVITCLDQQTGKEIWQDELETRSKVWASPVIADGKLICLSESGEVLIYQAGSKKVQLAKYQLNEEGCFGTPVVVEKGMLVRSKNALIFLSAN